MLHVPGIIINFANTTKHPRRRVRRFVSFKCCKTVALACMEECNLMILTGLDGYFKGTCLSAQRADSPAAGSFCVERRG